MALRSLARRPGAVTNGVARVFSYEPALSRRNASAMAVPTQSQAEETKNDYAVSIISTHHLNLES